jgi:acyl-CoA synthetase (AMP-forming)/AMP-acid ligase II
MGWFLEQFAISAESESSATAVADIQGAHTYRTLDRRVQSFTASWPDGVNSGDIVAVEDIRAADAIAAIIATWRIGAVCLPLSLSLPEMRVKTMVDLSGPVLGLAGPRGTYKAGHPIAQSSE